MGTRGQAKRIQSHPQEPPHRPPRARTPKKCKSHGGCGVTQVYSTGNDFLNAQPYDGACQVSHLIYNYEECTNCIITNTGMLCDAGAQPQIPPHRPRRIPRFQPRTPQNCQRSNLGPRLPRQLPNGNNSESYEDLRCECGVVANTGMLYDSGVYDTGDILGKGMPRDHISQAICGAKHERRPYALGDASARGKRQRQCKKWLFSFTFPQQSST